MPDLGPVLLSLHLAAVTTVILLVIGVPLAYWLATTKAGLKPVVEAVTALPLVLPPTVIGFYLLILMNPSALFGAAWVSLTGGTLSFSFAGLVFASAIYSLPFMVQPLQSAFEAVGRGPMEAAATLRASRLDAIWNVLLPQSARGILTACVLTFAHTIGEFGVVLMVGGNIPERTRVISIAIYEHVESVEYTEAHILSAGLLIFSFVTLVGVYALNRSYRLRVS